MSTQTEHLHLDLREAADIFNPLSTNANFESLDNIIYEIQTKGGVPTYTTTAAANLLKLSQNPTPNVTVFKFVAAGDANTWSYQESVNDIVALDGSKKTVKGGEMYVAWVNAANAMVVIAWPDVVDAQTFDGKGPAEWASKAQLDAVNQTAANATTTAQAAATVANQALEAAQAAGFTMENAYKNPGTGYQAAGAVTIDTKGKTPKALLFEFLPANGEGHVTVFAPFVIGTKYKACSTGFGAGNSVVLDMREFTITNNTTITFNDGKRTTPTSSWQNQPQSMSIENIYAMY